jgi:2,3-dimethylmalate lyase
VPYPRERAIDVKNNASTLRELISGGTFVSAPGCYDPLTARMVERAGFPAAYLSAWSIHVAQLGLPHLGVASMREYVDLAARITSVIDIPLIVDIEHGLGGPLEVRRAVQQLERVGVAAVSINDQTRGMGWMIRRDGVQTGFVSVEGMGAKIGAAKAAQSDADFVVIGRSDSTRVSAEEAIGRCNAYLEAGADVAMPMLSPWLGFRGHLAAQDELHGVIHNFVEEIKGPIAVHNAYGLDLSLEDAERLGIRIYVIPQACLGYTAAAAWGSLSALHDGTLNTFAENLPPMSNDQFGEILDFELYSSLTERFGV